MVTSILSILLTSICGIYLAILNEWQRQQGQGDSLVAISRTFAAVSSELSQAITVDSLDHHGHHCVIVYTLPLDKDSSGQYYVPKWVDGNLEYRPGPQKAFYLSDSSGDYDHTGDILWRGTISGVYPFAYTIVPDPTWDADAQRGRISHLDSLTFDPDDWGNPHDVTINASSSYKFRDSNTVMDRTLVVSLRNAD